MIQLLEQIIDHHRVISPTDREAHLKKFAEKKLLMKDAKQWLCIDHKDNYEKDQYFNHDLPLNSLDFFFETVFKEIIKTKQF